VAPTPLNVLLIGVDAADLERLRRRVSADPQLRVAGATTLDRAAAVDVAHEAVLLTPEAMARLRGARERHPIDEPPVETLTPREHEVLASAAEGLGNRDIGERLGISEHTVKFHLASIYGKLGVGNRTEAVQHALRMGILEI
jgi:DNA-binding NarL/FixJ family response regulator